MNMKFWQGAAPLMKRVYSVGWIIIASISYPLNYKSQYGTQVIGTIDINFNSYDHFTIKLRTNMLNWDFVYDDGHLEDERWA